MSFLIGTSMHSKACANTVCEYDFFIEKVQSVNKCITIVHV